jgi:hypothetical protein
MESIPRMIAKRSLYGPKCQQPTREFPIEHAMDGQENMVKKRCSRKYGAQIFVGENLCKLEFPDPICFIKPLP